MNLSTLTHIHLLLNHFPTVGFGIGLVLFLVGLYVNSDPIKRASLGIFLIIALLSVPVYMTGKAAQRGIQEEPDVSNVLVETHEDAALTALAFMEITGLMAWLGLWQFRRVTRATKADLTAVLVLSLITAGLMTRAANLGGDIKDPQIRAAGADPPGTERVRGAPVRGVNNSPKWAR